MSSARLKLLTWKTESPQRGERLDMRVAPMLPIGELPKQFEPVGGYDMQDLGKIMAET